MKKTCICCNTRRPSGEGQYLELCQICFDEAGYDNAHSDGHPYGDTRSSRANRPYPRPAGNNCHLCNGTDPHTGTKTTTTGTSHIGGVQDVASDRRLTANRNLPRRTAAQRRKDRKARRAQA